MKDQNKNRFISPEFFPSPTLVDGGDSESDSNCFVVDRYTDLTYLQINHRVLYAHTDRSGVVYHSNYLLYFEMGRTAMMRIIGCPYSKIEEGGLVYPLIATSLNYYLPLKYDEKFYILTRPSDGFRNKVHFEYLIYRSHPETELMKTSNPSNPSKKDCYRIICRGSTTHCSVNQEFKPVRNDPFLTEIFQRFPHKH